MAMRGLVSDEVHFRAMTASVSRWRKERARKSKHKCPDCTCGDA